MDGQYKPFSLDCSEEVERLEMALEAAGVGTWELDLNNGTIRWCRRTKVLYGFTGEDIVGYEKVIDLIHRDDRQLVDQAVKRAIDGTIRSPFDIEFRVIAAEDGEIRWLHSKGQAYFNEQGKPKRFLGTIQNVTADVQTRQNLQASEEKLRTLIENTPDIIIRWDKNLRLTFANAAYQSKNGAINNSFLGKTIEEMGHDVTLSGPYMESLKWVMENGLPWEHYNTFPVPGGESIFYSRLVPEFDVDGNVRSIIAIARDITELKASEARFQTIVEQAPMAIGVLRGRDMVIEIGNDKIFEVWGKDRSITGKRLLEALPEIKDQIFLKLLQDVYDTGKPFFGNGIKARLVRNQILEDVYFDFVYTPVRNKSGAIDGIMALATEVTAQVLSLKALEESESKLRSVIAAAPAGMVVFNGRDLIVDTPNQAFIDIIGKSPAIIGKPLAEAMPELKDQPFLQILDDVYTTGKTHQSFETQVDIVKHGVMTHNLYNFTYIPLFDSEGKVFAILDVSVDVTEAVRARQKLEESELFSRSIINNSPVAKLVLMGEEMRIRMVNENMLDILGKDNSIIGKTFLEALPELEGSPLPERLKNVLESGNTYFQPEEKIDLIRYGKPYTGYYNYVYKVLTNSSNQQYGVIITAIEVTDQVIARQKIEEAEESLRDAVALAELSTWEFDPVGSTISFSDRLVQWSGLPKETLPLTEFINIIDEKDRERVLTSINKALDPALNSYYLEEFVVTNKITHQRRILQARGRAFFDEENKPYLMRGTAQDVTEQRLLQISLEQQVQERTEELEASNQELASINEEYLATNEELAGLNDLLTQSNQNLQQFAYIASHDLQEPLRKIQSFGNMLSSRYKENLGEGTHLVERMQTAANRMSILIQDLLAFSRISNKQNTEYPVDLSKVADNVLSDLELTIQDTGAFVSVSPLPIIQGDESQLGQLFQNLIGNALKFKNPETVPEIHITFETVHFKQLPENVRPARIVSSYYRIDVADNGIGFDQKYADRIFQVFQRLHGRSEFAGTGIGLAICEKVALNHGGAIAAVGIPGTGATFSVYFPV